MTKQPIIIMAKTNEDYFKLVDYLMKIPDNIQVDFKGTCELCKHTEGNGSNWCTFHNIPIKDYCGDWQQGEIKTFKEPK